MSRTLPPTSRRPKRVRGFLLAYLGPVFVGAVAFVGCALVGWMISGWEGSAQVAGLVGIFALITVAGALMRAVNRLGRRLGAQDVARALQRDERPPVLLLRSFADDSARYTWSPKRGTKVRESGPPAETYEELLTGILRHLGPVVAIGDPRDRLPDLGAARMYLDDGEWQGGLLALLERAQLVVVLAGESQGVLWEIARVVERVAPERILLSLPRKRGGRGPHVDRERYEAFRTKTAAIFPKPLPAEPAEAEFLYFDDDWTPRLLTQREFKTRSGGRLGDSVRERAIEALTYWFTDRPVVFWLRMSLFFGVIIFLALLWAAGTWLSGA